MVSLMTLVIAVSILYLVFVPKMYLFHINSVNRTANKAGNVEHAASIASSQGLTETGHDHHQHLINHLISNVTEFLLRIFLSRRHSQNRNRKTYLDLDLDSD
jgi:hypothetical protein